MHYEQTENDLLWLCLLEKKQKLYKNAIYANKLGSIDSIFAKIFCNDARAEEILLVELYAYRHFEEIVPCSCERCVLINCQPGDTQQASVNVELTVRASTLAVNNYGTCINIMHMLTREFCYGAIPYVPDGARRLFRMLRES